MESFKTLDELYSHNNNSLERTLCSISRYNYGNHEHSSERRILESERKDRIKPTKNFNYGTKTVYKG